MKKLIIPGMAVLALAFTLSEDFLKTLDLSKEYAENSVWYSFSTGSYNGPASKTYHNFAVPVRVSMVKEIGAWAKAYTRSDDFKKKYAGYRDDKKPSPPDPLVPLAEQRKQARENIQKTLTETEANIKKATGETKKALENILPMFKDQLKQIDDPKNPMYGPEMEAMQKQGHDMQVKAYQDDLKKWEKEYPATADAMIKSTLKYFLDLSATVDFSAKLKKGQDDKMIFVNPEYENKPSDWKYIYRSGKESTDAARAIATQWLGEMK
jgi:hypothetical protein